jgi:hypothetical protein
VPGAQSHGFGASRDSDPPACALFPKNSLDRYGVSLGLRFWWRGGWNVGKRSGLPGLSSTCAGAPDAMVRRAMGLLATCGGAPERQGEGSEAFKEAG